jgi:hypothetical protein
VKLLILLLALSIPFNAISQDSNIVLKSLNRSDRSYLVLIKKGKKVIIQSGWIGLTTKTDTIKYFGQKDLSYEIEKITKDSIYVRAPLFYRYKLALASQNSYGSYAGFRYLRSFRKHKVKYDAFIAIDSFTTKGFSYNDILSVQYPPEGSNSTGCIMCIFLPVIPVANVWFYYKMRRRFHPRNYNLANWKMQVDHVKL